MKTLYRVGIIASLTLASACGDVSGPNSLDRKSSNAAMGAGDASAITVYTQNLYVGADVDAVVAALGSGDPTQALTALTQAVVTLHRTSFATRAAAIVEEIARTRPDVIGFQEGSKIDVDLTPLGLPVTAHEDFLATINDALHARGLTSYVVADSVTNIKASLLSGLVQLVDYDVVLVNASRVVLRSTLKRNFANNDGLFGGINLVRGFVEAQITVGEQDYVVVATHTEGTDLTPLVDYHQLHLQQMQEIVDEVDSQQAPVVVMGDLNDSDTSPMYEAMTGAGFVDVWRALHPGVDGNTCCHLSDLSDPRQQLGRFNERIDFVFARGLGHVNRDIAGSIARYGLLTSDRLKGPDGTIWPSDHAGLVATLVKPRVRGATP